MRRRDLLAAFACAPFAAPARAKSAGETRGPAIIRAWAATNGFQGVVLTGLAGRTVDVLAFGQADLEAGTPALPTTRYAIGSASKWLTTAAVLRLVDRGSLDLNVPITSYLPAFRADTGRQVTLRHLLSNSSGIPDRLSEAAKSDAAIRRSRASASEMVTRYAGADLAFPPGTRFDYSVLNWVIVRAMLESVSGEPFPQVMDRLVFTPLRLADTGVAEDGFADVPGLAAAYRADRPPVRKMDAVPAFAAASGTFYSNAADLLRAANGIFNSRLLSPQARREILTVRVPQEEYALGGRVHVIANRSWAWETGKIGGYRSHVAHAVEARRTIVVLGNTDMRQELIAAMVERLVTGPA